MPAHPKVRDALIADIGGTNVRFALLDAAGRACHIKHLKVHDYPDPAAAAAAYLAAVGAERDEPPLKPKVAAFDVASAVSGDRVQMTNHPWAFSIADLRQRLGLERFEVINDFTALALSVRRLQEDERIKVGGGEPVPDAPIAVIGPGTGLGVSGLISAAGRWVALAAEGGHVTMAASTEEEEAVLRKLRGQYHHVSAERVISGQGLVNLYQAMHDVAGTQAQDLSPAQVTEAAANSGDPTCAAAVEMMCAMLGTIASNLALTLGARGGVYIGGGVVPKLGELFARSGFRARFEEKGRFSAYLAAIPTWVIVSEYPAFLGLAALLEEPVVPRSGRA